MIEASPLVEIEQQVQQRARELVLDPDQDATHLRHLVEDTVAQWSVDHKRGLRSYDLADPELVVERAMRNLTGYGPLAPLLADDDVWEVMINGPTEIFVKRHSGPSGYHHEVFHDDAHVIRTLTKILEDASTAHRKLDPTEGLQDAQLDDGSRLHIVHGDIGRGGHVVVNIRKFTNVAFRDLHQLVEQDMLGQDVARFLAACVHATSSIVFAGAPGSGKTTMMSCCCAELDPSLRVVIAEEVFEADVPVANVNQTLCGGPPCPSSTPPCPTGSASSRRCSRRITADCASTAATTTSPCPRSSTWAGFSSSASTTPNTKKAVKQVTGGARLVT